MGTLIVSKFGGTSLANAGQIKKVLSIIKADANRRYVVVSAPGKSSPKDKKITDLLLLCHSLWQEEIPYAEVFDAVKRVFEDIVAGLGVRVHLSRLLGEIQTSILSGATSDFVASRGEWLSAKILAEALGYAFADAKDLIFFDSEGRYDEEKTIATLQRFRTGHSRAVIPGFYGSMPDGSIKTFPRGGSDITGAIVAQALRATMYENWTDVPGIAMVDPRIIRDAKSIRSISYDELEELADGGAQVFHQSAIFPARDARIPINIRNTNNPDDPGTLVVADDSTTKRPYAITGIAGKHFVVITVGKRGINPEVGFMWKILGIMKDFNVSVQHFPGSNNTISLAIERELMPVEKIKKIFGRIERDCEPDTLTVDGDVGIITMVGKSMVNTPGVGGKILSTLGQENINVKLISQGTSEYAIIVGVQGNKMETAIIALYESFVH